MILQAKGLVLRNRKVVTVIGFGLVVLLVLLGVGWIGLQIKPDSHAYKGVPVYDPGPVEVPSNLPDPVRQHFAAIFGPDVMQMKTAAVWGTMKMKVSGLWVWARFEAYYVSGERFVRNMTITWFKRPLLKGQDSYINGEGRLHMMGTTTSREQMDQGQNLALWGEAVWMPAIYVTHAEALWEVIDPATARLIVPFGNEQDSLTFHFDLQTHRMTEIDALRFRGTEEEKTPWLVRLFDWQTFHGAQIPTHVTVAWGDESSHWAELYIDGVAYNVDVVEEIEKAVK